MKFIEAEIPKYHMYENGTFKLMPGFETEYENYEKKRKALRILRETTLAIFMAKEAGVEIPSNVQRIRDEARSMLSPEDFKYEMEAAAGLVQSPGSKQAVKAGIQKDDPLQKKCE